MHEKLLASTALKLDAVRFIQGRAYTDHLSSSYQHAHAAAGVAAAAIDCRISVRCRIWECVAVEVCHLPDGESDC